MGEPLGEALLLDRRDEIAAADDDGRAGVCPRREVAGDCPGAVREGRDLEDAERPVPEHRLGAGEGVLDQVERLAAEVDDVPRRRDLLGRDRLVLGAAGDLLGDDDVDRQDHPDLALLGEGEDAPRLVDHVVLGQALADRLALGEQERVRHAAAEDEDVDPVEQVVEDLELARDLRPADDRRERAGRLPHEPREHRDLALHQEARVGRQELGDADRARVGAVRRAERVVHVQLRVVRELLRESRVVLLLRRVEPQVLEDEQLAVAQPLHRVDRADAKRIAR